MKRKIRCIDKINNEVSEKEINVPNKMHLDAQIRFRANVYKPKKGKGSFTRKGKYSYQTGLDI